MKASSRLFIGCVILFVAGLLKGVAPTALNQPFDYMGFTVPFILSLIVLIIGVIKHTNGK